MAKLEVFLLTYNRAEYLEKTINSILGQTYKDFILNILDNSSVDNTYDIIKQFTDDRINYIKNDINIGAICNANKAFELCLGEYMMILHDDNILKPTLFEEEIKVLENNKNIALVASNMDIIDEKGKKTGDTYVNLERDIIFNKYEFIEIYFKKEETFICTPTAMFRMSFIRENYMNFDLDIGPICDSFIWFEINCYDVQIYFISNTLLSYRVHPLRDSCNSYYMETNMHFYNNVLKLVEFQKLENVGDYIKKYATIRMYDMFINDMDYFQNSTRVNELFNQKFWDMNNKNAIFKIALYSLLNNLNLNKEINKNFDNDIKILNENDNLKTWIESLILKNKGISNELKNLDFHNVVIYGTSINAFLIYKDLQREGFNVLFFLDDNSDKLNCTLGGKFIFNPICLKYYKSNIDVVIIGNENVRYADKIQITKNIKQFNNEIEIISWETLVSMQKSNF